MANGYVNRPPNPHNPYAFNPRDARHRMPRRGGLLFPPPPPPSPEERGEPMFCLFPSKEPGMSRANGGPSPEQIFGLSPAGQGEPFSRPEDAPGRVDQLVMRVFEFSHRLDEVILRLLNKLIGHIGAFISSTSSTLSSLFFFIQTYSLRSSDGSSSWVQLLTEIWVLHSWSIIIGLVVTVVASLIAWFISPKGENQTYVHGTCIVTTYSTLYRHS